MTTAASTDHDRTFEYGVRAMAQAKRHGTSIEPIAYEVWYEHVTGHHKRLSAAVRSRMAGGPLTDADLRDLHADHLSTLRVSDRLGEIGADAQAEMGKLLETVRSALGDLAGMDADLRGAADRIAQPGLSGQSLREAVDLAVAMTRSICTGSRALQDRLGESQASIAALQGALEVSRGEAMTDGLTELFNRRAFDEQMKLRFERARTEALPLSVLMLDIDHFKSFNDTHGHPVGDQVIRLVGSCIRQRLATADMPARYGGEEFAVIGFGRELREAVAVAEDIRGRIDGYEIVQQGTKISLGKVTVSVGVAALRSDDTAATLVERADQCLYAAKRTGRNRVESEAPLSP